VQLTGRTILVGVTGGIACYKACEIVRLLRQAGATVHVAMTASAREFVTPLTFQTLAGTPVATDTFDLTQESEIGHIQLADRADAVLIAPATANVIAKMAYGLADDLLTTVLLATRAPLVVAPAMNVNMWNHAATRENVATLVGRGARLVGPASGSLACGWEGAGRLADPAEIVEAVLSAVTPQDLDGLRVLVSAGPTREAIDPVRHLSNLSTGKMGFAVARVARRRGATVTLVSGPTPIAPPPGVQLVPVTSAHEMAQAVTAGFRDADVLVMSAAVADYRPRQRSARKVKKGEGPLSLELERTVDILRSLVGKKGRRTVVGFAAETHDVVGEARRKLREKALDLIVANDVTAPGSGFGTETNQVRLIDDAGLDETLPLIQKDEVAARILDWVVARRNGRPKTRRAASEGVRPRSRAPRAGR